MGTSLSAILVSLLVGTFAGDVAAGLINVDLRIPSGPTFHVGQTVPVEIWFVSSTSPGTDWTAADVILEWSSNLAYKNFTDQPIVNLTSSTSPKQPPENGIMWKGITCQHGRAAHRRRRAGHSCHDSDPDRQEYPAPPRSVSFSRMWAHPRRFMTTISTASPARWEARG